MCSRTNVDSQLALVYSREEIEDAVRRVADEVSRDFEGQNVLLVVVLKGAFIFAADLVRKLRLPIEIDFVKLSSYKGSETTGMVEITKDIETTITGRNVLVVEDIVDTGITLSFLLRHLAVSRPKSLKVCTLIDKRERRRIAVSVDYAGIVCDRGFLIGYGLDLDECCRELEAIHEVGEFTSSGGLNDNSM
jgi:hypoxanthine phosphoribosyltransferase